MVLCLRFSHSVCCSFFNIIPRLYPVGSISRPSDSGRGYDDGPQFIRCVDGQQPKTHEVWIFGENGVNPKVHPTVHVDVGNFSGDYFSTNYPTPTWCRVRMFGLKSKNGSVNWIGNPSFLRNDGPPWTLNLLAIYDDWRAEDTVPVIT